jgi:hypothetical protein
LEELMEDFAQLMQRLLENTEWRKAKKPGADRGRRAIDGWSTEQKFARKATANGKTEPR